MDPVRDISDMTDAGLDPDQLGALILEVVPQSSCLVFCPTKKNCQNVALLLAKCLQRYIHVHVRCMNVLQCTELSIKVVLLNFMVGGKGVGFECGRTAC